MICVSRKPDWKNNDTTAMTTATNKTCLVWLDENYYLMGMNDTFNSGRYKFIKEDFPGGENL